MRKISPRLLKKSSSITELNLQSTNKTSGAVSQPGCYYDIVQQLDDFATLFISQCNMINFDPKFLP